MAEFNAQATAIVAEPLAEESTSNTDSETVIISGMCFIQVHSKY